MFKYYELCFRKKSQLLIVLERIKLFTCISCIRLTVISIMIVFMEPINIVTEGSECMNGITTLNLSQYLGNDY
jgi:hypothetical protein